MLKVLLREADKVVENILTQHYEEKNKKIEIQDAVTLGVFEDLFKKGQALQLLIEKNMDAGIDSLARGMMENTVYLKTLLSEDNKILGRSYYVANKRKELKILKTMLAEDEIGKRIRSLLATDLQDLKTRIGIEPDEKLEQLKSNYEDVFNLRSEGAEWYNLEDKSRNFFELCKYFDMEPEYHILYRRFSDEVHAQDVMKRIKVFDGELFVLSNTYSSDMQLSLANFFLVESIRNIYTFYGLKKPLRQFNALIKINYKFKIK
ncbi:DUF5677 domain-containing protein [Bacillus sp. DJP31]|uniref:DUF5677 domain-containing protein n=1 Tax=Bacillus sp. DJP31 TaxID=3409789 RepID=UPI003BB63AB5